MRARGHGGRANSRITEQSARSAPVAATARRPRRATADHIASARIIRRPPSSVAAIGHASGVEGRHRPRRRKHRARGRVRPPLADQHRHSVSATRQLIPVRIRLGGHSRTQEPPRGVQSGPRATPKGPQGAPRGPRGAQGTPEGPHKGPRAANSVVQEPPKGAQSGPRTPPKGPQGAPRGAQEGTGRHRGFLWATVGPPPCH